MKRSNYILAAFAAAFMAVVPLAACNSSDGSVKRAEERNELQNFLEDELTESAQPEQEEQAFSPNEDIENENVEETTKEDSKPQTVTYFMVTSNGVNIRSGAGTGYSVQGQAEKSTLYGFSEKLGDWYKTGYRNKAGYISSKYCTPVNMRSSGNELIEAVIEEGCKLLGTPYVYGATRLHDGRGYFYKYFTADEFDCSSLMQYIFYMGAGVLLDVNTRTQVYQGATVAAEELKRGDLMFFTNAQRKNNKGVETIGHVALYLGDNYILHTASDYAKIEQISATRWSYFVQAQRIL